MRDHWTFTSHAGFSLIEWVVVTLAGIVASFVIPRFTHLDRSVRASEVMTLSAH
jgi:Tfp pilus assembly protein FimT